jgi:hypothetical protein
MNKFSGMPKMDKFVRPHGLHLPDPFFDNYEEEKLTCWAILGEAGIQSQESVELSITRAFLKKIIHSHLKHIESLE